MTINHGTCAAYERHHCRCDLCRETHNARVRANRADRLASGRIVHGTRSAYDAGCRCDACFEARRSSYPAEARARTG
jgi:hypothetical protein